MTCDEFCQRRFVKQIVAEKYIVKTANIRKVTKIQTFNTMASAKLRQLEKERIYGEISAIYENPMLDPLTIGNFRNYQHICDYTDDY